MARNKVQFQKGLDMGKRVIGTAVVMASAMPRFV